MLEGQQQLLGLFHRQDTQSLIHGMSQDAANAFLKASLMDGPHHAPSEPLKLMSGARRSSLTAAAEELSTMVPLPFASYADCSKGGQYIAEMAIGAPVVSAPQACYVSLTEATPSPHCPRSCIIIAGTLSPAKCPSVQLSADWLLTLSHSVTPLLAAGRIG